MNNQKVHPIHILYSVIALTVVVWSVLYYQVKNAPPILVEEDISPPTEIKTLTDADRIGLQSELDAANPPQSLTLSQQRSLGEKIDKNSKPTALTDEEKKALEANLAGK